MVPLSPVPGLVLLACFPPSTPDPEPGASRALFVSVPEAGAGRRLEAQAPCRACRHLSKRQLRTGTPAHVEASAPDAAASPVEAPAPTGAAVSCRSFGSGRGRRTLGLCPTLRDDVLSLRRAVAHPCATWDIGPGYGVLRGRQGRGFDRRRREQSLKLRGQRIPPTDGQPELSRPQWNSRFTVRVSQPPCSCSRAKRSRCRRTCSE